VVHLLAFVAFTTVFCRGIILAFLDRWWLVLASAVGFIAVVFVMRRFWPPPESPETPNRPSITFL
jgi:hypothetical protein